MPIIYLYAEVLANIRQANLYASLETQKNEHTTIDIASDKKTITVSHDGETASLYLPTEIGGTAEVKIPVDRAKEMSVRLELADIMDMPSVKDAVANEGPWSANDLGPNTQLQCRACKAEFLTNETPLHFRDLPSEHWAEMMDFWHCHRPHDSEPSREKDAAEAAASKGYGSSNQLKATLGVCFVDNASFLFSKQDCRNIQKSNSADLHCSSCEALAGTQDVSTEGWRLYKSSLSVRASLDSEWERFPPSIFVSSQLLSLIESSAARKFVVHADDAKSGLLVWVFNPDIHYSSSRRSELVVRAMKLFYQETKDPQKLLDEHLASFEELRLAPPIFDIFRAALKESTDLLPPSARKFQEWTIGLLDRYQRNKSDGLQYFENVTNNTIERCGA